MNSLRILPLPRATTAEVAVPGSKSYTLRALLLAALTPGTVKIDNSLACEDTAAMVSCLSTLGIAMTEGGASRMEVTGDISSVQDKDYELDVDLSGVTLRFLLALSCVIPGRQTLRGRGRLHERPVSDMVDSLRKLGAKITYLGKTGYPPLRVASSQLAGGQITLAGTASSQYLSALLMVAPLTAGGLEIEITGDLASKPYVDMTLDCMRHFGVAVDATDHRLYHAAAGQQYRAATYYVEGDISSASYFFAIATLTRSTITVTDVNPRSLQADTGFLQVLQKMGSQVIYGKNSITIAGKGVKPLDVDMRDCPDQAQTLAVLASFASGETTINGIKSLRIKETERVKALEQELKKMGIRVSSTPDTLVVRGGDPKPASIETYGDHRMAMSFAVAGAKLFGMEIREPEVVAKTFPAFWEVLRTIGVATEPTRSNIVLIGMRGSGKTTVARELARKLNIKHVDLDEIMVEKLALSTPEIIAKHGWGYFRDQEAAIAKEISKDDNTLISTGGGIVLRPDNIAALRKNGVIVLLRASTDVMAGRLQGSKSRPPLTDKSSLRAEIQEVLKERQPLYESAADLIVDTDKLSPNRAADEIIARLGRRAA